MVYKVIKFLFLNYYYFFNKKGGNQGFAITRALNLMFLNALFLVGIPVIILLKRFNELRGILPNFKLYSTGYFIALVIFLVIHHLLEKKIKMLLLNKKFDDSLVNNNTRRLSFIIFFCIFFLFFIALFVKIPQD